MIYNYTNTTRVFEVDVYVYFGWLPATREELRLAIDDAEMQVGIDDYWHREPNGEVRIARIGSMALGLIYGEVPDLLTVQDWVIEYEDCMNEIAADYERETTWYLEDRASGMR